ncbi:MAG: antibiotic resistance protein [Hyphomicrobiales bacterium]|nr:antibiotic resistance protein [Hyphomicrobiales bacterium]MCP5001385.1 antibiotic resistance protein [Hyphomicrobiales bacterium]
MKIVFAGPSLAGEPLQDQHDLELRPPVKQGDLYLATLDRPSAIGIIDGVFDGVPSVWHKEILWALAHGIPVYGSSSMGALRAAELDSFGMIGVGTIYQAYRDGVFEDDDEVALQHGPAEMGYAPLTLPMVNVRATVAEAVSADILRRDEGDAVTAAAKAIFFKRRTWDAVFASPAAPAKKAAGDADRFDWLENNTVDQKKRDALSLLEQLGNPAIADAVAFDFEQTEMWERGVSEWQNRGSPRDGANADEYRLVPQERLFRWTGSEN